MFKLTLEVKSPDPAFVRSVKSKIVTALQMLLVLVVRLLQLTVILALLFCYAVLFFTFPAKTIFFTAVAAVILTIIL